MSNFVCPHCGMTNIDCEKEGYKTPRELELEQEYEELKEECEKLKSEGFTREQLITLQEKEIDRYIKALDEIEQHFEYRCDICRSNYGLGADCSVCWHKDIRNIIDKAKGNNND